MHRTEFCSFTYWMKDSVHFKLIREKHLNSIQSLPRRNITSFRRSLYAKENIKKGERFNIDKIISLRPYKGKSSKFFFKILKSKSKKNYKPGDLI